jgi:phage terminase Nu1 subunit (DNA packaging protein)
VKPDQIVTDVELGALAGVSARRIRQMAEDGRLERIGQNKYPLGTSIRALLEDAAGSGSALQRERTRKVAADATRAELELAKAMAEVAPIDEIARAWSRKFAVIRQNLMTVPSRVATRIVGEKDERRITAVLKEEISDGLRRGAEAEIDLESEEHDEQESD